MNLIRVDFPAHVLAAGYNKDRVKYTAEDENCSISFCDISDYKILQLPFGHYFIQLISNTNPTLIIANENTKSEFSHKFDACKQANANWVDIQTSLSAQEKNECLKLYGVTEVTYQLAKEYDRQSMC